MPHPGLKKLKAGTVANPTEFAASMAQYMEEAMKREWQAVKGRPLPAFIGEQDRKILFAAVAQGVIHFLTHNLARLETTEVDGHGNHRHTLEFGVDAYRDWS
jgi:hypothetical protein